MTQDFGQKMVIVGKLGEGSFSEVFKVKTPSGQYFAVKKLKKQFKTLEEAKNLAEFTTLRELQGHPNIIELKNILYDSTNGYLAIVLELMDQNLYEALCERNCGFDESSARILIYQLLKALSYMHSKNMFHRDIKPENCMIRRSNLELKLVDFGTARYYTCRGPYSEYIATRWYRAPESILTAGGYGPEIDVWAVGCVFYELLTNQPLFPGKFELDQICLIHSLLGSPSQELLKQFSANPNSQISFAFPYCEPHDISEILPPEISDETVDLLRKLLIYSPLDRITVDEALNHPCFNDIREAEKKWMDCGYKMPLSEFFLNPPPQPLSELISYQKRTSYYNDAYLSQYMNKGNKNNFQIKYSENSEQPKKVKDLLETRKAAVERIKAYSKSHSLISTKKNCPKKHTMAVTFPKKNLKPFPMIQTQPLFPKQTTEINHPRY